MTEPRMQAAELQRHFHERFAPLDTSAFEVEHVEAMGARVRLRYRPEHLRPGGTLSGPSS